MGRGLTEKEKEQGASVMKDIEYTQNQQKLVMKNKESFVNQLKLDTDVKINILFYCVKFYSSY